MYGDSAAMQRRVAQLREQALDLRALGERLVAEADAIDWHGRAADAMRARMRDRAAEIRDCANQHDTAADHLHRHTTEVIRLQDSIADIERRATGLVADATARIAEVESHDDPDGVRREARPEDQTLASFVPPRAGHKDWLTVELPGL